MADTFKLNKRELYWQKIKPYIDKPVIKIITGSRRSGKSYFLRQIIAELKKRKIKSSQIIYIDKEDIEFDDIRDYKDLNEYIKPKIINCSGEQVYLLIDEVQEIAEWERCIRSVLKNESADIIVTGSNAQMLSSELATTIAGRYVEIPLYPLSFKEFLEFYKSSSEDINKKFDDYMRLGGLPGIHRIGYEPEVLNSYLSSVLNTIILKDVIKRNQIRNYSDFENVLHFVFDNVASTFSARSISDYLKSQKLSLSIEAVRNYLLFLEAAYLIHKVRRYDLQGKRHLEIYEKYYLSDHSFRHTLIGYKEDDVPDYLENIVYLELRRRGYEVSIGKLNGYEIDFIATKQGKPSYYQVCYHLSNDEVIEREFKPLRSIKDQYPKYVLSMDLGNGDREGIKRLNLVEFLLG